MEKGNFIRIGNNYYNLSSINGIELNIKDNKVEMKILRINSETLFFLSWDSVKAQEQIKKIQRILDERLNPIVLITNNEDKEL